MTIASSASALDQAGRRAALEFERIVEAVEGATDSPMPRRDRREPG